MITPYLASALVNLFEPHYKSQFRLINEPNSTELNDSLKYGSISVTLYSNMLTVRVSFESFKLDGDLLKTMTINIFNVGRSNPQDRKKIFEIAKKMKGDNKKIGRKRPRNRSIVEFFQSPAIMASRISIIFLSENPNEICDSVKLLLQEKQAGKNADSINDELVAIVDKLLDCTYLSKKQHKQFLNRCYRLHTKNN